MAEHISQHELTRIATVSDAPARSRVDRNFGLPSGLYAWTVGLYLPFVGLMALLFSNPELVIPLVVIGGFVAFAFGVAAVWTKMSPDNNTSPMTWGQLSSRGIETLSGHLTAGEAAIQVLILPVLILAWGFAIAVIVALT
jgi:hypothetical protein